MSAPGTEAWRTHHPPLYHWLPSSELGGIEVAALTVMQSTPWIRHVVLVGDIAGPAAGLWREAGAEVILLAGWSSPLGLRWGREWRRFVAKHAVRQLIAWSPTRLPLLLAPLAADCRCVVHLGNATASGRRARWQAAVLHLINRPRCRPRLLACSQTAAAAARTDPVFRGQPVMAVPNAVRPGFFEVGAARPAEAASPARWGMLARLDGHKDHGVLIEAVRRLPAELGFSLEFVGSGSREAELRRQVASAGLGRRIIFSGATARPEDRLRDWQAFVFATTAEEGFGIAVAEAMAAGLPCVLSDVPALREVAGDAAYFAEPSSPDALVARILEVCAHPAEAARKAAEGRQRALARYSAQAFAREYLAALCMELPQ